MTVFAASLKCPNPKNCKNSVLGQFGALIANRAENDPFPFPPWVNLELIQVKRTLPASSARSRAWLTRQPQIQNCVSENKLTKNSSCPIARQLLPRCSDLEPTMLDSDSTVLIAIISGTVWSRSHSAGGRRLTSTPTPLSSYPSRTRASRIKVIVHEI